MSGDVGRPTRKRPLKDYMRSLVLRLYGATDRARYSEYQDDPCGFARDVLGLRLFRYQKRILRKLVKHRRVAVPGGHGMGKTWLDAVAILWFVECHPGARVFSTAPTFYSVDQRLWANVRSLRRGAIKPMSGEMLPKKPRIEIGDKWDAEGISTKHADRFQGGHAPWVLIVFTESTGVPHEIYVAAESMMINEQRFWLMDANPTESAGDFYQECRKRDRWHVEHLSCYDHPNVIAELAGLPPPIADGVTLKWCEDRKRDWGEDHPYYIARVLGQFPESSDNRLVSVAMLEAADREDPPIEEPRHMGVDIAYKGADSNVAVITENGVVIHEETWSGQDTMQSAGRIIRLMDQFGIEPENVHIDVIGYGAGVVDRLREQAYAVDGVSFATKPYGDYGDILGPMKFANRRAELHWVARQRLRDKTARIPERYAGIWRDLTEPTYAENSSGHTVIEKKDEIKKRLGRSPDHGDAYVLSLSRSSSAVLVY